MSLNAVCASSRAATLALMTPRSLISTFWLAILASNLSFGLFWAAISCAIALPTSIDPLVAELVQDVASEKPLIWVKASPKKRSLIHAAKSTNFFRFRAKSGAFYAPTGLKIILLSQKTRIFNEGQYLSNNAAIFAIFDVFSSEIRYI